MHFYPHCIEINNNITELAKMNTLSRIKLDTITTISHAQGGPSGIDKPIEVRTI